MKYEIAILLDKDINYYKEIVKSNNTVIFEQTIETWDSYYTNKDISELDEENIKNSCIRNRNVIFCGHTTDESQYDKSELKYSLQNMKIINMSDSWLTKEELDNKIKEIASLGFKLIDKLTTHKIDYQFRLENMKSALQFQLIDNIGLVLYYDNPDYYGLSKEEQKAKLLEEIQSYNIPITNNYSLDKLKTLLSGEIKYS